MGVAKVDDGVGLGEGERVGSAIPHCGELGRSEEGEEEKRGNDRRVGERQSKGKSRRQTVHQRVQSVNILQ